MKSILVRRLYVIDIININKNINTKYVYFYKCN